MEEGRTVSNSHNVCRRVEKAIVQGEINFSDTSEDAWEKGEPVPGAVSESRNILGTR